MVNVCNNVVGKPGQTIVDGSQLLYSEQKIGEKKLIVERARTGEGGGIPYRGGRT